MSAETTRISKQQFEVLRKEMQSRMRFIDTTDKKARENKEDLAFNEGIRKCICALAKYTA